MTRVLGPLLLAATIGLLLQTAAGAGIRVVGPQMRTYVSGTGLDTSPCTVAAPCRTLQAALAKTSPGGQITVLNSADYGPMVIGKAVSVTSEGAIAGVLATNGVALTINAGANDVINLRGLDLDGGSSGSVGIQFNSGAALNIQKSTIRSFVNSGIGFAPSATGSLFVADTVVSGNGNSGILISGAGSAAVNAMLTRVTASQNGVGIFANGASATVMVSDSVSGKNSYGVGANSSAVMVRNSTLSNNAIGIAADQSAVVRVGQSTLTGNGTGWSAANGGQVQSYGNNNVTGNAADGGATSTIALQ
jgi:hypothetical protein